MPYIDKGRRDNICPSDGMIDTLELENGGDLNFAMTEMVHQYLRSNGLNYARIAEVMAAYEGSKAEFYRLIAAPYEDKKAEENGNVFDHFTNYPKPKTYA